MTLFKESWVPEVVSKNIIDIVANTEKLNMYDLNRNIFSALKSETISKERGTRQYRYLKPYDDATEPQIITIPNVCAFDKRHKNENNLLLFLDLKKLIKEINSPRKINGENQKIPNSCVNIIVRKSFDAEFKKSNIGTLKIFSVRFVPYISLGSNVYTP